MKFLKFSPCFLLSCFLLFIHHNVFSSEFTWSEGKCDDSNKIYEGATRDFYNRAARLPWKNLAGDWIDANSIKQGIVPYALLVSKPEINPYLYSADVTMLVRKWLSGNSYNHGFLLKSTNTNKLRFASKESPNISKHPVLFLQYADRTYDSIIAEKDTILSLATYICSGHATELFGSKNILLYFNVENSKKEIIKAKLILYSREAVSSFSPIPIFATNIPLPDYIEIDNMPRLDLSENHHYIEDFESDSWEGFWDIQSGGTHKVVSKEANNGFTPFDGNALKITIPEGEHYGLSAFYYIEPEQFSSSHAYLHYNLKLDSSWYSSVGGKLPGFTGTYMNRPYRAGWGGRASNGNNGWSARGLFGGSISDKNLFSNHIPIGSYLYHTNVNKTYGAGKYWNLHPNGMLQTNRWYSIEQYIKINKKNINDGELKAWVNGQLVYHERNINFTNHPQVGLEAVWINIYHGGKKTAMKDLHLYIDNLIISNKRIGTNIYR